MLSAMLESREPNKPKEIVKAFGDSLPESKFDRWVQLGTPDVMYFDNISYSIHPSRPDWQGADALLKYEYKG